MTEYPKGVYTINNNMRKNTTIQRLHIIKGQIDGLINLMEKQKDCHKITEQFYAINAGLKKAIETYFKDNLSSCLKSINFKKRESIEFLLKEIIKNK